MKFLLKYYKLSLLFVVLITNGQSVQKKEWETPSAYIVNEIQPKVFTIASHGRSATIYIDPKDWKGVNRAAKDLANDIGKVTGTNSTVFENSKPEKKQHCYRNDREKQNNR